MQRVAPRGCSCVCPGHRICRDRPIPCSLAQAACPLSKLRWRLWRRSASTLASCAPAPRCTSPWGMPQVGSRLPLRAPSAQAPLHAASSRAYPLCPAPPARRPPPLLCHPHACPTAPCPVCLHSLTRFNTLCPARPPPVPAVMADLLFFGLPDGEGEAPEAALAGMQARLAALSLPAGSGEGDAQQQQHQGQGQQQQQFDSRREYLFQDCLHGLEGRPPSAAAGHHPADQQQQQQVGSGEAPPPHYGPQWAYLRFSQPVTAPADSLVIGSKLDVDLHAATCRLAFAGRLCAVVPDPSGEEGGKPGGVADGSGATGEQEWWNRSGGEEERGDTSASVESRRALRSALRRTALCSKFVTLLAPPVSALQASLRSAPCRRPLCVPLWNSIPPQLPSSLLQTRARCAPFCPFSSTSSEKGWWRGWRPTAAQPSAGAGGGGGGGGGDGGPCTCRALQGQPLLCCAG